MRFSALGFRKPYGTACALFRKPDLHHLPQLGWLAFGPHQAERGAGRGARPGCRTAARRRSGIGDQARHQLPRIVKLVCPIISCRQRVRSHHIGLDGTGHHRADDLVWHVRGFFTGRGGNGCQLAMAQAQRQVFSLLARPGNSRRSSTAADNSPPWSRPRESQRHPIRRL